MSPMYAIELSDDTILVKGAQLTGVDGIAEDGSYGRMILAIVEGYRNDNTDGDPVTIPLLLRADAIARFAAALTNIASPTDTLRTDRAAFIEWVLGCRRGVTTTEPSDDGRRRVDDTLAIVGEEMGFDVHDKATIEAMLFGIAASQAVHVALSDSTPADPGFAGTVIGAIGMTIDGLIRRLPGIAP